MSCRNAQLYLSPESFVSRFNPVFGPSAVDDVSPFILLVENDHGGKSCGWTEITGIAADVDFTSRVVSKPFG